MSCIIVQSVCSMYLLLYPDRYVQTGNDAILNTMPTADSMIVLWPTAQACMFASVLTLCMVCRSVCSSHVAK